MIYIAGILIVFFSAVLARIDGGGLARMNEWVERLLVMSFFVAACSLFAGWWSLVALIGMVGIATGHGQYFINRKVDATEPERVDFIVRLFLGDDPRTDKRYTEYRGDNVLPKEQHKKLKAEMEDYGMGKLYKRCALGMCLTGFLVGLPAAILAGVFGEYNAMVLFLLTGPLKALAYIVAYEIWGSTVQAEYINGAFRGLICAGIMVALL